MGRKLAAILAADVVGYSKLMADDETGTLSALKRHRAEIFDPAVARHNGRVVKLMGDGALVEFGSVVDAVGCAVAIQAACSDSDDERIQLRIGINLGDVIIDNDDIYGDGVNVAARLQAMAEPGGICISGIVRESLGNKIEVAFRDVGEHRLKNIDRPIRVFRWMPHTLRNTLVGGSGQRAEKPSIAVLAFDNMSGDPEQEYFSNGIAEDIITALSHFREFFVIARNTTFTYKGRPVRANEVCRDLGARYLLEGSVRKAGHRVRVTAQLIDGETGAHLWADRFDRDLDDIFVVQDEITQAIVSAVAPETLNAELKRSQLKPPENLSAWDKVLRARWHLSELTQDDNDIARRLLEEATRVAPGFADAFSTLALCHLNDMLHLWCTDRAAAVSAATAAAGRAVSLDPNDARAQSMLGMAALFNRDFDAAFDHLHLAIRLNPSLANAHGILASVYGVSGDYEAAKASFDRAVALSPRDRSEAFWSAGVGMGAYVAERYEDCVAISRRVLRDHPGFASSMRQLTAALAMLGRKDEAAVALQKLLDRMPGLTVSQVRHIVPVRASDDHERWLEGLRRAGLPD